MTIEEFVPEPFHYYWMEQNWRIERILIEIDDFLEYLRDIRLSYSLSTSPAPPREFDPFQTIGKY